MQKVRYILALILLVGGSSLLAQQLPMYSQYMLNPFAVNPAEAGVKDHYLAITNTRFQWVGMTDAPRTYMLSVEGPHKTKDIGFGGVIYNDVAGAVNRTGGSFVYAYHFQVTSDIKVSAAMSGGLQQFNVDGTKIKLFSEGDLILPNTMLSTTVLDFGVGGLAYSDKFKVGLALPQLLGTKLKFSDFHSSKLERHIFLHGSYYYDIDADFRLEPSAMFKFSKSTGAQIDLGAKVTYKDFVWAGLVYRHGDATSIMIGYKSTDEKIIVGYSYDMTSSNLNAYSTGTHEIMLAAKFGNLRTTLGESRKTKKLKKVRGRIGG